MKDKIRKMKKGNAWVGLLSWCLSNLLHSLGRRPPREPLPLGLWGWGHHEILSTLYQQIVELAHKLGPLERVGGLGGAKRPRALSGVYCHPLKWPPFDMKNQPQSHSHRWGGGGIPARKNHPQNPQKNFLHHQRSHHAQKYQKNSSNLLSTQNYLGNLEETPLCYHLAPLHPVDRSLPNPEGS